MHVYIYDNTTNQPKYQNILAKIETRVTDLGLNGKIVRLGLVSNIYEAIETEVKRGAKTIVAVGDNLIFCQAINAMANLLKRGITANKIPLGFIPIAEQNNKIAEYFGISNYHEACNFISARRVESIGLGVANDQYFLNQAEITTEGTILEINQDYTIEILEKGIVYIVNLPTEADLPEKIFSQATDNLLELYIKTGIDKKIRPFSKKTAHKSVFKFQNLIIVNKKHRVVLDNALSIEPPVHISVARDRINLIVGKSKNAN